MSLLPSMLFQSPRFIFPLSFRTSAVEGRNAGAVTRRARAFTLVEMLVVIAIIAVLAALVVPALPGLLGSKGTTLAVDQTAGVLALARTEAMARRTYVWVLFLNSTSFGNSQLRIGAVASLDGTANTGDPANLRPITKVLKVNGVQTSSALPANVSALLSANPGSPAFDGAKNLVFPAMTIGDTDFPANSPGILFSPNGEALSDPTKMTFLPVVDIGLVPTKGAVVLSSGSDGAIVRYLGGSGNVQVFRP